MANIVEAILLFFLDFLPAFFPLIFIIVITVLIVKAVKRKHDLERYKAETERMKVEAEINRATTKDID